jgi:hypothetical protein
VRLLFWDAGILKLNNRKLGKMKFSKEVACLKATRVHQHRDKMLKVLPGDFVEMGVLPALAKSGQKLYRRDRILVMGLDRTNLCMKNYRSVPNRWKY